MRGTDTGRRIMTEALRLFARDGYEAVSVGSIAAAVGIRAPSLYKHYRSKRDIFASILREMERRDAENAERFSLPTQTKEAAPGTYEGISAQAVTAFCEQMFRYWTQDEFAAAFRRMLTVEQYRSEEMSHLTTYFQYGNLLDLYSNIFRKLIDRGVMLPGDPELLGLEYIAPTALLIQVCDREPEKLAEVLDKSEKLIDLFIEKNFVPTEEQ